MVKSTENQQYFENITSYNRLTWAGSALMAVALNLLLFLLMPQLMHKTPSAPAIDKMIPRVHITRVKEREPEKRKREVKPPKPPEPEPKAKPRSAPKKKVAHKLTMPFEINPRLPSGPSTLDLPPMETGRALPAGNTPEIFSEGKLDAPLTVLVRIPPTYPLRARRSGIEGSVKVSFVVNKSGNVKDVKIIEADPDGVFEKSVRQCVSGWRFEPGTIEGVPVKTRVSTTIQFELD